MLLQFSAGTQLLPPPLLPGTYQQGSMHFFVSALPLRAAFGADMQLLAQPPSDCDGFAEFAESANEPSDITACLTCYAQSLAANPFKEQHPMLLRAVVPQFASAAASPWMLRSAQGAALPLDQHFKDAWRLHSIAGGAPVQVFGLWDGSAFLPLAVTAKDSLYNLENEPVL